MCSRLIEDSSGSIQTRNLAFCRTRFPRQERPSALPPSSSRVALVACQLKLPP